MAAAVVADIQLTEHVEIDDLAVGYDGRRVLELDRLAIRQGELMSILGPSGCGKTTLLNTIAGFVTPDTGTVRVDGADITGLPPYKRGLGMVFQNYALFPHLTVADNVAYGLKVRRLGRTERDERVREALDLVGLGEYAGRRPRQLSGGQQQRVAMARALATRPSVLLLDEPLSNLDAKLRRQIRGELRAIQRRTGTTMIFVTHDQEEALSISDRIAVLNGGQVEQLGTPDEVYRRPATRFVAQFIGAANVLEGEADASGRLPIGSTTIPVPGATPGAEVVAAIRPERIRLVPESGSPSASTPGAVRGRAAHGAGEEEGGAEAAGPGSEGAVLTGTVGYRAFAGHSWQVEVAVTGGPTLTVQVPDSGAVDPPAAGTRVGLAWEDGDLLVLGGAP